MDGHVEIYIEIFNININIILNIDIEASIKSDYIHIFLLNYTFLI